MSSIAMARQALVEQRGIPAMASIVGFASTMSKPEFLHRCISMTIRNLSSNAPDPLKVRSASLLRLCVLFVLWGRQRH